MFKHAITAATLGLALVSAPAIAGEPAGESLNIQYKDLNLATPEGQARLDSRVESAARKVCQIDAVQTGTRIVSNQKRACFKQARKSVEKQMAAIIADQRRGG